MPIKFFILELYMFFWMSIFSIVRDFLCRLKFFFKKRLVNRNVQMEVIVIIVRGKNGTILNNTMFSAVVGRRIQPPTWKDHT